MTISATVGFVLFLFFFSFVIEFGKKAKRKEKTFVPVQKTETTTDGFKPHGGNFGNQKYEVSVQNFINDGGKKYFPIDDCLNFLVIDLKFKENNPEILRKKLIILEGVVDAEVHNYKIVIHRPCVSAKGLPELWEWNDVWKNVEEILEKHYK